MTQHPLFQEIEEDLNRQKLEALWKRYGVWVMVAAAAVILVTAGATAWNSWRTQQEQKATAGLMDILDHPPAGDSGKEVEALESFAGKNGGDTQATFARLHAASLAAKDGDLKKAASIYDEIANNTKADPAFRQLADLYSVQAQMDSGDPVSLQQRLQPLLADNAPWRFTAMETGAFLALRAGDKAKAKQMFTELSQDSGVPPTLAARASDMVRYLGE